jgi:hypothetical protein
LGDLQRSEQYFRQAYNLDASLTPAHDEWGNILRTQCWEIEPDQVHNFAACLDKAIVPIYGKKNAHTGQIFRRIRLLQKKYAGNIFGVLRMIGDTFVAATIDFAWLTRRDVMADVTRNLLGNAFIIMVSKTVRRF